MGRRVNDGAKTGLKQDRYRNSRFEWDDSEGHSPKDEMSQKTINTLGGVFQENRGHRVADEKVAQNWQDSPFEDGKILSNWNKRRGWDEFYEHGSERGV
jgi:hypothetical protein